MTVVYSFARGCRCKDPQGSVRLRPKDYENDGNGALIEYKVEGLSWRRYSNVRTVKIGSSNSSSQSMVEAIAAITDDAHDEKIKAWLHKYTEVPAPRDTRMVV